MLSKQGMFDQIQQLRNETGRIFEIISSSQCQSLWKIYQRYTRHKEFREKARYYLGW